MAPAEHLFLLLLIEAVLMIGAGLALGVFALWRITDPCTLCKCYLWFLLEYKALSLEEWLLLAILWCWGCGRFTGIACYFYSLTDGDTNARCDYEVL